jgi:hypothetical protein
MIKTHAEFVEKYSEIPLEMLCEALWNQQNEYTLEDKKISLGSVVYSDVINCKGLAEYYFGKDGYVEFSFRNGNLDGTVVESYGENTYFKPTRTVKVFVLDVDRLIAMGRTDEQIEASKKLFKLKENEIREIEGKMNYDLYFSPTIKIEEFYRQYAIEMFLKIDYETFDVEY